MSTETKQNIIVFPKTLPDRGMLPHRIDMGRIAGKVALLLHKHLGPCEAFWEDIDVMLFENIDGLSKITVKTDKKGRGHWLSFLTEGEFGLFRYEYLIYTSEKNGQISGTREVPYRGK
tara:strand:+ start:517 stop:870 length:354 start_codon:yes stop_codon:yes gene_type:complete